MRTAWVLTLALSTGLAGMARAESEEDDAFLEAGQPPLHRGAIPVGPNGPTVSLGSETRLPPIEPPPALAAPATDAASRAPAEPAPPPRGFRARRAAAIEATRAELGRLRALVVHASGMPSVVAPDLVPDAIAQVLTQGDADGLEASIRGRFRGLTLPRADVARFRAELTELTDARRSLERLPAGPTPRTGRSVTALRGPRLRWLSFPQPSRNDPTYVTSAARYAQGQPYDVAGYALRVADGLHQRAASLSSADESRVRLAVRDVWRVADSLAGVPGAHVATTGSSYERTGGGWVTNPSARYVVGPGAGTALFTAGGLEGARVDVDGREWIESVGQRDGGFDLVSSTSRLRGGRRITMRTTTRLEPGKAPVHGSTLALGGYRQQHPRLVRR